MAERKVLNKYFPKNFDHERIVKRGRGKDKLMIVRNMLPMSLRCNTCANYLYIGTKFNMRMEICNDEVYLGIKVFRFYLKCTYCYADITFKTDPKNHDYVVETGGTRNYEPMKDAQQAEKLLKKMKVNEKEGDSMKYLESKTYDSKRQMELTQTLEEIKNLNRRQGVIDPQDLLKNIIYLEEEEQLANKQLQKQMDKEYEQLCEKNLQKKMKQMQQAKVNSINGNGKYINGKSNYISIEEENQDEQPAENFQNQNFSQNHSKLQTQNVGLSVQSNGVQKNGNSITQNSKESSGKKLMLPVIKSKLDKYKKKIIKKDAKPEQKNQPEVEAVLNA